MKTPPPNSPPAGNCEAKRDGCDMKRPNLKGDALSKKTPEKPDKKSGMQAWWSSHANRNNW